MRWALIACLLLTFVGGCSTFTNAKKKPENPNLAKKVRQRTADVGDINNDDYQDSFDEAAKSSQRAVSHESDWLNKWRDPQAVSIEKSVGVY